MKKMPVSASSHSKPSTVSSAWSKLVQVTKTASKTSRHDDAKKAPVRRQSSPASTPSISRSSRPVKRRRVTGPPQSQPALTPPRTPSSPADIPRQDADCTAHSPRSPAMDRASTTKSLRSEKDQLGTRARSGQDAPASEGERNLLISGKCESLPPNIPPSSPTHGDMRSFWGLRAEEGNLGQQGAVKGHHKPEREKAVKTSTAADGAENGKSIDIERERSRHDAHNELLGQLLGSGDLIDASGGMAQRDNTDTAATTSTRGATAEDTQETKGSTTRGSSMSRSLRGGFKRRSRTRPEHETGRLKHDHEHEHDGQATIIAADPKVEDAAASPTNPSGPPPGPTPGLHESTPNKNIRAPESTELFTSTSSTSPTDKENPIARKPKRRLTLYDTQPQQQAQKKRKAPAKQAVQTTLALAIGGSAGMRECKVCDTVYNPFHPEDVKVHAKRHAGVVRKERGSAMV